MGASGLGVFAHDLADPIEVAGHSRVVFNDAVEPLGPVFGILSRRNSGYAVLSRALDDAGPPLSPGPLIPSNGVDFGSVGGRNVHEITFGATWSTVTVAALIAPSALPTPEVPLPGRPIPATTTGLPSSSALSYRQAIFASFTSAS